MDMDTEEVGNDDFHDGEKKLRLTRKYRNLMEKMQAIHDKTDRCSLNASQISQVMEEADQLLGEVRHPDIALLDAKVVSIGSNVVVQTAQALDTNLVSFKPEDLCDNIMSFLLKDGRPSGPEKINWEALFPHAVKCFKRTPSYTYLYGTFEPGEVPTPKKKVRKPRENEVEGCKKQPEKLMVIEKESDEIQDTMNRIMKTLNKALRENDNRPISYFDLVINPNDYGATLENIFHVSFLVRDNYVDISFGKCHCDGAAEVQKMAELAMEDLEESTALAWLKSREIIYDNIHQENLNPTNSHENGLPVIEPTSKSSEGQRREPRAKNQMVFSINMQEWEDLKNVYEIKEPMIKPRQKHN